MLITSETSGVGGGRAVTLTVKLKKYEASAMKGLLENLAEHVALGAFAKEVLGRMAVKLGEALKVKQKDMSK
jgi:hypothetical protein